MRRVSRGFVISAMAVVLGLVLIPLAGCASGDTARDGSGNGGGTAPPAGEKAWLDIELTDAVTGETYAVSDFAGKPVLLHAFAVW